MVNILEQRRGKLARNKTLFLLSVLLYLSSQQISSSFQDELPDQTTVVPRSESTTKDQAKNVTTENSNGSRAASWYNNGEVREVSLSLRQSQTDIDAYSKFKTSGLYQIPFDPEVLALPAEQVEFVRKATEKDVEFYNQILNDAIETRNNFAAGSRLMLKYGGRLILSFLKHRREEMKLKNRIEPMPSFFTMLADLIAFVESESDSIRKQRDYSKANVNIEDFRERVMGAFEFYKKVINNSPVAGYVRWDEAHLYTDDPNHKRYNIELKEEAADLYAVSNKLIDFNHHTTLNRCTNLLNSLLITSFQYLSRFYATWKQQFRGIGYENTSFICRRLVNMLRLFSRGEIPASPRMVWS